MKYCFYEWIQIQIFKQNMLSDLILISQSNRMFCHCLLMYLSLSTLIHLAKIFFEFLFRIPKLPPCLLASNSVFRICFITYLFIHLSLYVCVYACARAHTHVHATSGAQKIAFTIPPCGSLELNPILVSVPLP